MGRNIRDVWKHDFLSDNQQCLHFRGESELEILLIDMIVNPMKLHVCGFVTSLFDGVVYSAACCAVISIGGSC